jgi:cellulose synthase/poly-beta-1,6-N-acetylglucosamine synthase-like glycosyltransferase
VLTRLQYFEYWLAMQIRFIAPWLVSGACQVARTPVLKDVMSRHSPFFQGNDVEIGLLSEARGYRIGHIAFEIKSDRPATFIPWLRQRLAWAGGQFRLFMSQAAPDPPDGTARRLPTPLPDEVHNG